MNIINGFNIAAEIIDFFIALTMLYLAVATKPKQTAVFSVVFYGEIFSILNILLHILIVRLYPDYEFAQGYIFKGILVGYYITYLGILLLLFSYMHLLSLKQRTHLLTLKLFLMAFAFIYLVVMTFVVFGESYISVENRNAYLTDLFMFNIAFGLADVVAVVLSTIVNSDGIPHVLMRYILVFVPIETGLLVVQLLQPHFVFLSITYVLPFMLCFIMFHSILFDEVTGCQNKSAFEAHFANLKKNKEKMVIYYVTFPRLEGTDNLELIEELKLRISSQVRALERRNRAARVYMIDGSTFAVIFPAKNDLKEQALLFATKRDLDRAMDEWEFSNSPEYRMLVIPKEIEIDSMQSLDSFIYYLTEKARTYKGFAYLATIDDYVDAMNRHRIEREIVDIRNKNDLFDERIVVYVQPIYDVHGKNFRNAEALMRLNIDGELISPELFVPLAERVGCVHTLTRIILNKVCKKVYEIQDYYDFDAISVNVSITEFMDYGLHDELIGIIHSNGIPCEKIRLEITESMESDSIDAISHNMEEFNKAGVQFYLDDFGTGYSNLERIVSLPFKTIKFDKSLLYKSESDPILMQLIKNMVDVFKSHNLIVLIEGVESQKQAELSIGLGFEFIQGYNYAVPVLIDDIQSFFNQKRMA